VTDRFSSDYF